MQRRNDNIHIKDLKLSNHKNVLAVSVEYSKRSKVIALRIQPLERNPHGFTMVALIGGPRGANIALEACGRFNEKRLVAIAEDLKANGKDAEYGDQYEEALSGVLDANGYVLAFRDTQTGEYVDAYREEEFAIGQRVVYTSDFRGKTETYAWVVDIIEPDEWNNFKRYDLIADSDEGELKMICSVRADGDHQKLRKSEIMGDAEPASAEFIAGLVEAHKHQQEEKQEAKRIEDEQKAAASAAAMASVKAEFPWAQQYGSDYARGAANLKMQLQMAFPGVQFSVKSESYSMGCSIRVHWTDGPTEAQVNKFAERYQYSYLSESDYYTDGSSHKDWDNEFRTWMGEAKYVSIRREYSADLLNRVGADFEAVGQVQGDDDLYNHSARRALDAVEITGPYRGLALIDGEQVPTFEKTEYVAFVAPVTANGSRNGITVRENSEKCGVEIKFAAKPEPSVLSDLKAHGFRWSKFQKLWYAKANERTRAFAYDLAGSEAPAEYQAVQAFDTAVEDSMAAVCFA